MIQTSKVKKVASVKEYNGQHGTIHYHLLVMDNGDKINLGKKKVLQVGEEITYEIVERGQQEYNKAKSVKKEFKPSFDVNGQRAGHSVTAGIYLMQAGISVIDDDIDSIGAANYLYKTALKVAQITEMVKNNL
jgi:hypothetical protein